MEKIKRAKPEVDLTPRSWEDLEEARVFTGMVFLNPITNTRAVRIHGTYELYLNDKLVKKEPMKTKVRWFLATGKYAIKK